MRTSCVKNGLVVGVILLLVVAVSPISGSNIIVLEKVPKPDLLIIDASVQYYPSGVPYYKIVIQNCGDGTIPSGTEMEVHFTIIRLFQNKKECFDTKIWRLDTGPLYPGAKDSIIIGSYCIFKLPFFFIGRGFLEVDPNDKVNESDEQNNVVWAYIIGTGSGFDEPPFCLLCYYLIGKLRQQESSNNIGDYQFTLTEINDCPCQHQ